MAQKYYEASIEPSYKVTAHQLAFLRHLATGHTLKAIAHDIGCSAHTLKNTRTTMLANLNCTSTVQMVVMGFRKGWLT